MERTEFKDGTIYIGELEFTGLMKRLIHSYQFRGNGDLPIKVVLPAISEVEGVAIVHEEVSNATTCRTINAR